MNRDRLKQESSGDLISREETLTAFADYVGSGMSMDDYDALWDIVAKMPAVNPTKTGWIPVNERMPENRKEVLVTDGTDIFTGWYEGDKWCSCYEEFWLYSDPIIAWMPLPAPYEPQERSDKE